MLCGSMLRPLAWLDRHQRPCGFNSGDLIPDSWYLSEGYYFDQRYVVCAVTVLPVYAQTACITEITHIPGWANVVADALSRFQPPQLELAMSSLVMIDWNDLVNQSGLHSFQSAAKWPVTFRIGTKS